MKKPRVRPRQAVRRGKSPVKKFSRLKKSGALMAAGIAVVGGWEGMKLVAYEDKIGTGKPWTVCFGETRGVKQGDVYTKKQCEEMLGGALVEFESGMRGCLKNPDKLPAGPYLAFLSLTYNIGIGGFCGSSVARHANAGNIRAACKSILLWNKAGGRVVQGLVNRRRHENKICLHGLKRKTPSMKKRAPARRKAKPKRNWPKRWAI